MMPIPSYPEPTLANLVVWTVAGVVYGVLVGGLGAFGAHYLQLQAVRAGSRQRYVNARRVALPVTAVVALPGGLVAVAVGLGVFTAFVGGGERRYYESRALRHVYPDDVGPADWTSAWADGETAADYLWTDSQEVSA